MSLTKSALEEMVITLYEALQDVKMEREHLGHEIEQLREENRQLGNLLLQASEQYQELYNYVMQLHEWATQRAA